MHTSKLLGLSALMSLALLVACGSGSNGTTHTSPSTPVFTSVPATAATQDVAYSYRLAATDPAEGSVSFALTTSPTGASLSGSTVTWTPTAAESRISNNFVVTATTTSGGTATQSWTVTPGGTITVNWVNTYWTAAGPTQVPAPSSDALNISAVVANADGSITVEKSSETAPGVFSIPNVPGGYYWLSVGGGNFWTSSATFDAGRDTVGPQSVPVAPISQNTLFEFNLSGLESVPQSSVLDTTFPIPANIGGVAGVGPNSTTLSGVGFGFGGNIDWSKIDGIFLLQYVPTPLGSLNDYVLGSGLAATNLSLIDGATNTITETLQTSPQVSFDLSVPGSQWQPLFTNAAPSNLSVNAFASALSVYAQPYVTGRLAPGTPTASPLSTVLSLTLAGTAYQSSQGGFLIGVFPFGSCDTPGFSINPNSFNSSQPAITADQDFGTLEYADPFPSAWTRAVSFCEEYDISIPMPDSSATATFALVDATTVPPSAAPSLAPIVSQVQNPTIGGTNFFNTATLNSTIVPLSWSAPAVGSPYGYLVRLYVPSPTLINGTPTFLTAASFSTAKTSITLPPLAGGLTYIFTVTALADGTANMETAPFRSSLPTGSATVISGPVTISSTAQMPAVHGDRKVIERFSQPQSAGKGN